MSGSSGNILKAWNLTKDFCDLTFPAENSRIHGLSDDRLLQRASDGSFLLWDLSTSLVSAIPQPVAFKPPYCDDYITDYVILPERSTRDDVYFCIRCWAECVFRKLKFA